MTDRILAMASDHGGYEMKALLKDEAVRLGWAVLDLGTDGPASVDYPDYAAGVAAAIREGRAGRGVLVCGSGIGISIAANRFPEIRAALIHDSYGARMCRLHNDANVMCLGGRTTGIEIAKECLTIFLDTAFEGGRHANRVAKLAAPSCR
ncbi:MAG: ribose 5-phosphate isomerase B [Alphaproteobacteria bacterium]|nr:ribose 5-phosphate isomerase B [Alphaproteobacteria bacterium]MBF0394011.1 ribose 5-phosphate isomerase B [Alphaproteobacteria bacterium]